MLEQAPVEACIKKDGLPPGFLFIDFLSFLLFIKMRFSLQIFVLGAAFVELVAATPLLNPKPFDALLSKRQSTSTSGVIVDLGYEIYQGVANASTGLNTWKGYFILDSSFCRTQRLTTI